MLNKLISDIAIAKQKAKGQPATAPEYITPLAGSGAVAGVEPSVTVDEETGQVYAINAYVEEVASGFDAPVRAYPKTLGLLLLGIMGTVKSTQVSEGPNHSHVFTVDPKSQDTPWFTIWGNIEKEEIASTDAKLSELEISFEGNKPLECAATFAAIGVEFGKKRPSGGTGMAGLKYFTPAGCEVKLDVAGQSLEARKITKFALKMSRNVEPEYFSGSPLPGDLAMGKFEAAPTFTVKPDDLADVRKANTGSAAGTAIGGDVVEGAFSVKLTQGDFSLLIEANRVPFKVAWPESDAGGGAVELEVSAENLLGTYEEGPLKVTLVNDVAKY